MQVQKTSGRQIVSLVFTCAILAGAFLVLSPFLLAIIWAAIIATASWPLYQALLHRLGGRTGAAAACTTGIVTLALVGPTIAVVYFIVDDVLALTNFLIHANAAGEPAPAWLVRLPGAGSRLDALWQQYLAQPAQLSGLFNDTVAARLSVIQDTAQRLLVNVSGRLATLLFALWVLFFFYRDGPALIARVNLIGYKWLEYRWPSYVHQVPVALRAAVNGLVIVGFGEALLLSALYWLCGVPSAVLLGVLTAILAFVPLAGPLVLAVVALVLFASGSTFAALALFLVGVLILMAADYTVRPLLIQGGTELPFLGILFGIFGGVVSMGIVGLIIGPVILVLLMVLLREAAIDEEAVSLDFGLPAAARAELAAPAPVPPAASVPRASHTASLPEA